MEEIHAQRDSQRGYILHFLYKIRHTVGTILILLFIPVQALPQKICDMGMAKEWCDAEMLLPIEGVWEFPDDHTRVLVKSTSLSDTKYDIIVIESPDTRLTPGESVGYIQESPVSSKFEMALYRDKVNGVFAELGKCLAEYQSKDDAIVIHSPKVKLSVSARWLLPKFWRILKLSYDNPLDALPHGMVRIYPRSLARRPAYL